MVLALRHTAVRVGEVALALFKSVGVLRRTRVFALDRLITQNFSYDSKLADAELAIVSKKLFKQEKSRGSKSREKCPLNLRTPNWRLPADELN